MLRWLHRKNLDQQLSTFFSQSQLKTTNYPDISNVLTTYLTNVETTVALSNLLISHAPMHMNQFELLHTWDIYTVGIDHV